MSVTRSRSRSPPAYYVSPFTPQSAIRIGRTLGRGARNLFDAMSTSRSGSRGRSMSRSTSASRSTSTPSIYGGNATKPFSRQYRKRYRSRRVRRRARKYYKKFAKALRKVAGVALQKVVINSTISATALPTAQQWLAVHMGSYASTVTSARESGQRDLRVVLDSMTNTKYTDDVDNSSKRMIDYCICDMTVTNTGIGKLEVDKYTITYNDDLEFNSLSALQTASDNNQVSLTSTATDRLTINNRGVTLFDLGYMMSVGRIKIINKEKIFLNAGDTCNFQAKIKRPLAMSVDSLFNEAGFAKQGYTTTHLFVFKSVAGDTNTASLTIGSTRSYGYRVDGQSIQGNALLAA